MENGINTPVIESLPFNADAERSVLGAIILENESLTLIDWLSADDFYQENHQILFRRMFQMLFESRGVDYVTLRNELSEHNELESIGGMKYLFSIVEATPSTRNIIHYAKIVSKDAKRRQLIRQCHNAIDRCLEREEDPEDIAPSISISGSAKIVGPLSFQEIAQEQDAIFQKQQQTSGEPTGIQTGLTDIDTLLDGMQPEDLIILAGRPSMGKTACACSILEHVSQTQKVLFFSAEQNRNQMFNRMIAKRARINAFGLRTGRISSWKDAYAANVMLGLRQSWIDHTPGVRLTHIVSTSKRIANEFGLDMIIIDYLGLVRHQLSKNISYKRGEVVGEICHSLKSLARELRVPILTLCQLNRETEETQEPNLSNLRESGDIEQDADVVLFLWRKLTRGKQGERGQMFDMMSVAKHRNGPTGQVKVIFRREYAAFYNATQEEGEYGN